MTRRRMISPAIWDDPEVGELDPLGFKLFIGCISLADDDGRLDADPRTLRKTIFGYTEGTSVDDVRQVRDSMAATLPNVQLYQVDGREYIALLKWNDHQAISASWHQASIIPPPPAAADVAHDDHLPITCPSHDDHLPTNESIKSKASEKQAKKNQLNKQASKKPAAAQRESLPNPPENNNGDQSAELPPDTFLPDAETQMGVLFGKGGRAQRSWSVPAAAGGADSLGDALLDAFCVGISIPVDSLPDKKQRQWAAELRKVPEQWAATHDQAVAALVALFDPESEHAWKSYSTPYAAGFQDDWGTFLARALQGLPLMRPKPAEVRYYGGRGDFPD